MVRKYEFHKIAEMFPFMSEEEFKEFKEDIKKNGLQEPIVLYEGKILDGRNRYNACKELNIEPETKVFSGKDPTTYIISKNLFRRHLNLYQKTKIAMLLLPKYAKEARKQQGKRTDLSMNSKKSLKPIDAVKEACRVVGIGTSSYYQSKFVQEKIEERRKSSLEGKYLAEGMEEQLEGGEVTLNRAYDDYQFIESEKEKAKRKKEDAKIEAARQEVERQKVLKEKREARKTKKEKLKLEEPLILWENLKKAINEYSDWYSIYGNHLKDKAIFALDERIGQACDVLEGIKSSLKQKTGKLLEEARDITKGTVSRETTEELKKEKSKIIDIKVERGGEKNEQNV